MAHYSALVMKVATWGTVHHAQNWIVVGIGCLILGAIIWDFKTSK